MSNVDSSKDKMVVERDGIRVEKSFEPDNFPVPAIAFVIHSDRDEPVQIRLADIVPDDIKAEDIGFHPNYGADHWDSDDNQLVFEREFDSHEEYTTVYGLRARDTETVERFFSDPVLESVTPPLSNESTDESGHSDASVSTGADDEGTPQSHSTGEASGDTSLASTTSITANLAAEIRDDTVSHADLEVLRDAVAMDNSGGSVEARISHLQTEISDIQAYAAALEEFLDENGQAQTLLADLQETIDEFDSDLGAVRGDVDDLTDTTESLTEMEGEMSDLSARVQSLDDRLGNVSENVGEIESGLEKLNSESNGLRSDIDAVDREVENVREEIPDEDVSRMEEQLGALDDQMGDLKSELDNVAQMRERMAKVFSGAAVEVDSAE
jgi:peptidoglycan hydrolase CwlO-like protein